MAEASISVTQAQFICSICLDILKNPVTIPCGHSYCMNCITDYWNYLLKFYSCPQCRQTFNPRPVLNKNVVMAEMVENLKTLSFAGPEDVECDVCTGKKCKAVKSCLVCLESYCQTHFERHEEFHSGRRHKVTDATGRLKQMICFKHDKQLEIYCRTDQCCICYLCTMDEHRNHDTVTAVLERTEKQKQLEDTQRKFQQTIQDRQKNLQELKETHGRSTQTAVESSQRIYVDVIYETVIGDRENTGGLLVQLEQEIEDLKTTEARLKQLSITNDHIYFLQCFQSLVSPLETLDGSIKNSSLPSSDVRKSVSELKKKLERLGIEKRLSDRGEATASPFQRSQYPLPSLQPPPLPPLQLPPRPLPSLPTRLPTPSLQSPPGPPRRSQHSPPPLPSLPPPPSPPPPLRLQHSTTPPQSLQSPPTQFRSQYPLPQPSALRSQQLLPSVPPSLRSQQPPTPPPKPLRLQFPVSPPLRSQTSVESPPPPLPPPLRSQNSLQSPPPLPPPLRSQSSVESPPPLPPLLRSQNSVESPPPLPLRSQSSPPPLPPSLRSHR